MGVGWIGGSKGLSRWGGWDGEHAHKQSLGADSQAVQCFVDRYLPVSDLAPSLQICQQIAVTSAQLIRAQLQASASCHLTMVSGCTVVQVCPSRVFENKLAAEMFVFLTVFLSYVLRMLPPCTCYCTYCD